MYHLVASVIYESGRPEIFTDEWFTEADAATIRAAEVETDIVETGGIMDWWITVNDQSALAADARGEIMHLCLDDSQPYYEHRGGWRDNYDAARFAAAKKRHHKP